MPLNYVTITGTFDDGSGTALSGTAIFTPSQTVFANGIPLVTAGIPVSVAITGGALQSVHLLATDNTGLSYEGGTGFFFWTVSFTLGGVSQPGFSFFLPHTPTTVDLTALANTAAGGGVTFPITIGQGGTGQTTASAALAALGGAAVAGDLGGTSASPTVAKIQGTAIAAPSGGATAFLNALGNWTTTGVQNLTFTFGSTGAAPSSGTFTAGAMAVDQNNVLRVCTASGTPGTWARVGQQPYQFYVDDYGAKGNGQFLYDASMNGTTAVLTGGGLPAPSAPSVSNSGSGGTVLAGTYKIQITYVNRFGETLGSSQSTTTTSGSTSTITVNSPAPWTNATAYYVYCSQAGGSTLTRQQAPGSPTPLRTNYVITAPPSSGGAGLPGSNTSGSTQFTSGDVGKSIVVPSAGGFLNVPLVSTISSFQNSGQVTLANVSASAVTGYGAIYGTDDTTAIQNCLNAAIAFAQTAGSENATGEVIFGDKIYCVAGAPGGTYQNAQIQIPFIDPYVGPKIHLKLTGPQTALGPVHWEQPNPPAAGCTIASMYYNDSGTPLSPPQVVIGGPASGAFGGNSGLFSNMRVVVDGINVLVPYRCSISGLDLFGVGQADVKSFSYFALARTSTAAGGYPPYIPGNSGNPSPWRVWGYRSPTVGNNALNNLGHATVYGPYQGVIFTDHFTAQDIQSIYCQNAVSVEQVGNAHHCFIASLVSEQNSGVVFMDNGNFPVGLTIPSAQAENAITIIDNANNNLHGEVRCEMEGNGGLVSGGKNSATNIRLIWDDQPLGHVSSSPTFPASTTAFVNQYWRDATVTIHTGAGVTVSAISLDGTSTGMTMAASSNLTLPLRSGGSITFTYAGGTPTWDWWLG